MKGASRIDLQEEEEEEANAGRDQLKVIAINQGVIK